MPAQHIHGEGRVNYSGRRATAAAVIADTRNLYSSMHRLGAIEHVEIRKLSWDYLNIHIGIFFDPAS